MDEDTEFVVQADMIDLKSWREHPVGVVGAGCIGEGLAHALAMRGAGVVLLDKTLDASIAARDRVSETLQLQRLVNPGAPTADEQSVLDRIHPTAEMADLKDCGVVVENVPERWEIKREVYAQMDLVCGNECVFVPNTSCFPIERLAAGTARPERFVGIHFMNPVPLSKAAELIPSGKTSEAALAIAQDLLKLLGKRPIHAPDSPGFISSRILMLTINEAIRLVEEGGTSARAVDQVFRGCFGHKMGPLEIADLIGLATVRDSLAALEDLLGEARFRPCELLSDMVASGKTGRRAGEGFYRYRAANGDG